MTKASAAKAKRTWWANRVGGKHVSAVKRALCGAKAHKSAPVTLARKTGAP